MKGDKTVDNYKNYIGTTVVVLSVSTESVFLGKIQGTSPHRIRYIRLSDGRELKLKKDDVYMFERTKYDEVMQLVDANNVSRSNLISYISGNSINGSLNGTT